MHDRRTHSATRSPEIPILNHQRQLTVASTLCPRWWVLLCDGIQALEAYLAGVAAGFGDSPALEMFLRAEGDSAAALSAKDLKAKAQPAGQAAMAGGGAAGGPLPPPPAAAAEEDDDAPSILLTKAPGPEPEAGTGAAVAGAQVVSSTKGGGNIRLDPNTSHSSQLLWMDE